MRRCGGAVSDILMTRLDAYRGRFENDTGRARVSVREPAATAGRTGLDHKRTLERFLADVERRAFVTARLATGNAEDAHDIVQDAMLQLVRRYAGRDEQEWGALFHRILQRRIYDWYRRNRVRNRWRVWFNHDDENSADPLENLPDGGIADPVERLGTGRALAGIEAALARLPLRQQQAFVLRVWEGFDVEQTARAMGCSAGSVKTHYSRAVHRLRESLKGDEP